MKTKELEKRDREIATIATAMVSNQHKYGKYKVHKRMAETLANKLNGIPVYLNY